MGTATIKYAGAASITISLTSLSGDSWRQSLVVDNTTNKYMDALVGGSIQVGGITGAGSVKVYAYGAWDSSNYTAGCDGTDSDYTANGEEGLLKLLETISVAADDDNQDFVFGPVSVAEAFGGVLPSKWGIVVHNDTDTTLHATGTNNAIKYDGIKYDVA